MLEATQFFNRKYGENFNALNGMSRPFKRKNFLIKNVVRTVEPRSIGTRLLSERFVSNYGGFLQHPYSYRRSFFVGDLTSNHSMPYNYLERISGNLHRHQITPKLFLHSVEFPSRIVTTSGPTTKNHYSRVISIAQRFWIMRMR